MRCGIIVIALLSLLATPALATSPPEMVPFGHWCYDSIEYLVDLGVLPGLYKDWFVQDKQLSRWDAWNCSTLVKHVVLMDRPYSIPESEWETVEILSLSLEKEFGDGISYSPAYDKVDNGHWSYRMLDYLCRTGVLEGYPEGFFIGDKILTRYEVGQAIARTLDSLGSGTEDEIVYAIAECLREEFRDELAELNRALIEQGSLELGLSPHLSN